MVMGTWAVGLKRFLYHRRLRDVKAGTHSVHLRGAQCFPDSVDRTLLLFKGPGFRGAYLGGNVVRSVGVQCQSPEKGCGPFR